MGVTFETLGYDNPEISCLTRRLSFQDCAPRAASRGKRLRAQERKCQQKSRVFVLDRITFDPFEFKPIVLVGAAEPVVCDCDSGAAKEKRE